MLQNHMKAAKQHVDYIGMIASLACAVHCLAIPVGLLWLGTEVSHNNHLIFDLTVMTLGICLIAISLFPTIKATKSPILISLLVIGVLAFGLSFFFESSISHVLFAIGGMCWAGAHAYKIFVLPRVSQ